jgi:hypothetical protein
MAARASVSVLKRVRIDMERGRLIDFIDKLLNGASKQEIKLCLLLIRSVVGRAWLR